MSVTSLRSAGMRRAVSTMATIVAVTLAIGLAPGVVPGLDAQAATKPAKVKSVQVKPMKASSAKVTWKKASSKKVKGYYVAISASKSFAKPKTYKVEGRSSVSKTVKSLKPYKRYYVKVRAYSSAGKGAWSAVTSFKTKAPSIDGWWVTCNFRSTQYRFSGGKVSIYETQYDPSKGCYVRVSSEPYRTHKVTLKRRDFLYVDGHKWGSGIQYLFDGAPSFYRLDKSPSMLYCVFLGDKQCEYLYSGGGSLVRQK